MGAGSEENMIRSLFSALGFGDDRVEAVAPPSIRAVVSPDERRALTDAAAKLFGFRDLLPFQAEIMACTRRGENILAILPTGAGKSLCYQLPAFLDPGLTLVISPLIALMKDQVDSLPPGLRGHAIAINSSLDGSDLRQAMINVAEGRYRLVYAAPERLRQPAFLHALRRAGLSRLVIDEAHCVSMWGHDFRPDYLAIAQARDALGTPPLLAMTATAPPRTREDIARRLFDATPRPTLHLITADTFRPNLRLSAFSARDNDDKRHLVLRLCQNLEGSGIVYARTRQRCEDLAAALRAEGIAADHYHAGLDDRGARQDRFMRGDIRVIVATIAFGMGVDKADIRFVLHDGLPDSLESYYQEAGRAGRDGQPADCVLLYTANDEANLSRRAQGRLIAKELLRDLYDAVRGQLQRRSPGPIAFDDLKRGVATTPLLQAEDTTLRVALSVLEQAGLLRRHPDIPRQIALTPLRDAPAARLSARDEALRRFTRALALVPGQTTTLEALALCDAAGLAPQGLEAQLLDWEAGGHLALSTSGRRMLIELLKPPRDANARIDDLLSQYADIQSQRVAAVAAYAHTHTCRHGHMAAYLGAAPRRRCAACDNCTGQRPHLSRSAEPSSRAFVPSSGRGAQAEGRSRRSPAPAIALHPSTASAQMHLILVGLSEGGWGRRNLIGLLQGRTDLPERARANPAFGKLGSHSGDEIESLIERLLAEGSIDEKALAHGGVALGLTPTGRTALRGANKT